MPAAAAQVLPLSAGWWWVRGVRARGAQQPGVATDHGWSRCVWLCTGLFVAVYGRLAVRMHDAHGTQVYDFGIFDQGLWLLSQFRSPFVTVRGLHLVELAP